MGTLGTFWESTGDVATLEAGMVMTIHSNFY